MQPATLREQGEQHDGSMGKRSGDDDPLLEKGTRGIHAVVNSCFGGVSGVGAGP